MLYLIRILLGFVYSIILTFLGVIATGMGHGKGISIFWILSLFPIPLVFWSLIGLLLCRAESKNYRIVIYCLLAIHYLSSFIGYVYVLKDSPYESFSAVLQRDPWLIILNIVFYSAGQFFVFYKLFTAKAKQLH